MTFRQTIDFLCHYSFYYSLRIKLGDLIIGNMSNNEGTGATLQTRWIMRVNISGSTFYLVSTFMVCRAASMMVLTPTSTPMALAPMAAPRALRIAALPYEERTKNERERIREAYKTRLKNRGVLRLCVVQSTITSHLLMRQLDFPYKKRTPIPSKSFEN